MQRLQFIMSLESSSGSGTRGPLSTSDSDLSIRLVVKLYHSLIVYVFVPGMTVRLLLSPVKKVCGYVLLCAIVLKILEANN